MNAEYYEVLAGHLDFIKKAHKREMAKWTKALEDPAPLVCSCCRRKMAEKHRLMPNAQPGLKLVHSRD